MVVQGGRYSSEITMDAAYIPGDAAYERLQTLMRSGDLATIRTKNDGVNDEEAQVVVTGLDRSFPDQGVSIASVTLQVTGAWGVAS